jgi:hypothetical protein
MGDECNERLSKFARKLLSLVIAGLPRPASVASRATRRDPAIHTGHQQLVAFHRGSPGRARDDNLIDFFADI